MQRCAWVPPDQPDYVAYHDEEWGVPVTDDRTLFEFLTLEGAQAGLSWSTILRKRPGYRAAFADFDPGTVSRYTQADQERLAADPTIVRNRAKIASTITNATAFLAVQDEHGSFSAFLWSFADGRVIQPARRTSAEVPTQTGLSRHLSQELKQRGFRFVGPTIMYAYLQATGVVNDHTVDCFRHAPLAEQD